MEKISKRQNYSIAEQYMSRLPGEKRKIFPRVK